MVLYVSLPLDERRVAPSCNQQKVCTLEDVFWPLEVAKRRYNGLPVIWGEFFPTSESQTSKPNPPTYDEVKSTNQDVDSVDKDRFTLVANLNGFKPGEIKVKAVDGLVTVDAETERELEEDGMKTITRQHFHKTYRLPDGVKQEYVKCSFNREGLLKIIAPLPAIQPSAQVNIPIAIEDENVKDSTTLQDKTMKDENKTDKAENKTKVEENETEAKLPLKEEKILKEDEEK